MLYKVCRNTKDKKGWYCGSGGEFFSVGNFRKVVDGKGLELVEDTGEGNEKSIMDFIFLSRTLKNFDELGNIILKLRKNTIVELYF